jgi:hypothetical protein
VDVPGVGFIYFACPTARLFAVLALKPSGGTPNSLIKKDCSLCAAVRKFTWFGGGTRVYDNAASVHTCVRLIKQFIMRFCTIKLLYS